MLFPVQDAIVRQVAPGADQNQLLVGHLYLCDVLVLGPLGQKDKVGVAVSQTLDQPVARPAGHLHVDAGKTLFKRR